MDTELLRTFIEVSKTRHFGRAAVRGLAKPDCKARQGRYRLARLRRVIAASW